MAAQQDKKASGGCKKARKSSDRKVMELTTKQHKLVKVFRSNGILAAKAYVAANPGMGLNSILDKLVA
jgi:hypothetical protein